MKQKINIHCLLPGFYFLAFLLTGCKKQNDFLDAKPNQSLVVPGSLDDLQTLLNNTNIFNAFSDPALGLMGSDDYYILSSKWTTLSATERNAYIWAQTVYNVGDGVSDWSLPYQQVYYANTVLDELSTVPFSTSQQSQANQIKATALFYRSYAFFNLLQVFALPYDAVTSKTDLGIPLRLTASLTDKSVRASVQTCYDQIISDLKTALPLLPVKSSFVTKPSQIATNGLLARIYLSMSDYTNAGTYANACLAQYSVLTDYNSLNTPTITSINNNFIDEDIYHTSLISYSTISVRRNTVVDSVLFGSYDSNDLRKTKFFKILDGLPQYPRFVGSYDFLGYKFDGLATDEIYLIRAECYARAGNTANAMNDLNTLLVNRWITGTFIPYTATSADDALNQILLERRKELIFRGIRWSDLRRLNKEDRFKVTLQHIINGVTYTLPPNDPKYALPIPDTEIALSGIQQNPR